jgi:hypothetical protein
LWATTKGPQPGRVELWPGYIPVVGERRSER